MGAALVGNILGYGSLSYLLGDSVLRAAYLALIFTAASRIVESLVIIAFQVKPLTYSSTVRKHRALLRRRTTQVLRLVIFLLWLNLVLKQFQLSDPLMAQANAILNTGFALGAFRLSLGQILGFIAAVWASFVMSKFLRFLLEEDVYGRLKLSRGLPYAISSVLHYTVLMIGFFIALAALGVDMTKFTILAGAFSVGVGFGLQNVINNFVSGLIVLFERPIKVGDVIQVGDAIGSVKKNRYWRGCPRPGRLRHHRSKRYPDFQPGDELDLFRPVACHYRSNPGSAEGRSKSRGGTIKAGGE